MLYTDVSVSLMQNFVAILLIFLLYRYIQRKITFKRIILDILIAIIFSILYLFISDASLLVMVLMRLGWHFHQQKENKIKTTDTANLILIIVIQLLLVAVGTIISQFTISIIKSDFSQNILNNSATDITLLGIFFAVLFDGLFFILLKNKRTELQHLNQEIIEFSLEKQYFIFIFILFIVIEIILAVGNLQGVTATILLTIIIIFCVLIGMTFWQVMLFLKAYSIRQEANDQFVRNQQLQDYLVNIEQQYTELRRFKHDYQNILLSLESFAEKGDQQQFKAYYQELLAQRPIQSEIQGAVIAQLDYLKNDPIRGLVIQKFLAAKQAGVTLKFEMTEPIELATANLLTVIRIIGILLDNAIEQAVQETDQLVSCAFLQSDGLIEITIENTASQVKNLQAFSELGYSTKGAGRGTGLANVQDLIAKQTNLFLETQIENRKLRQTLMITEET
ncbi:GHKL domain-containing protein [Latilactobacillus curvatus]|uniref:GHKL domain-containing protein n=7 Tax=Latilactobacillus TaxID=2767885 RepID=A0A385AF91_LATCU|nr:GHKL domain-containing protein [Latilactobacillus curvatus]AXN36294.1 GHKL domain-containing protein [Latilactobacillus curvatus]MCT1216357.1 GHKL domain-containing protein [Latilactobacillus curvatus]MCT2880709.1 GHKL domain-containing protein [Latilactobacillus curvatus]MCT3526105.1 GHKL domain-containing protein [Latilactobacillus curvatus]